MDLTYPDTIPYSPFYPPSAASSPEMPVHFAHSDQKRHLQQVYVQDSMERADWHSEMEYHKQEVVPLTESRGYAQPIDKLDDVRSTPPRPQRPPFSLEHTLSRISDHQPGASQRESDASSVLCFHISPNVNFDRVTSLVFDEDNQREERSPDETSLDPPATKKGWKPVGRILDPAFSIPAGTPAEEAEEIMTAHVKVLQPQTTLPTQNEQTIFSSKQTMFSKRIDISEPTLVASSSNRRTIPIVHLKPSETEQSVRRRYSMSNDTEGTISNRLRKFKDAIKVNSNSKTIQKSIMEYSGSRSTTPPSETLKIRRSLSSSLRRLLPRSTHKLRKSISLPETSLTEVQSAAVGIGGISSSSISPSVSPSKAFEPLSADRKWVVPQRGQDALEANRADVLRLRDMMRDVVHDEQQKLKEIVGMPGKSISTGGGGSDANPSTGGTSERYGKQQDQVGVQHAHLLLAGNDADDTEVSEGEAEVVEILLGRQARSPKVSTGSPLNSSGSTALPYPLSSKGVTLKRAREEPVVIWDSEAFPEPPFRVAGTVGNAGKSISKTGASSKYRSANVAHRRKRSFSNRFFSFKGRKTITPPRIDDKRGTFVYLKNFLPALPPVTTDKLKPITLSNEPMVPLSNEEKKEQYDSLSRTEKAVTEKHIARVTEKKRLERLEAEKIISFPGYGNEHPSKVAKSDGSESITSRRSKSSRKSKKSRRRKETEQDLEESESIYDTNQRAGLGIVPNNDIPNTKRHNTIGRNHDLGWTTVEEKHDGTNEEDGQNTAGTMSTEFELDVPADVLYSRSLDRTRFTAEVLDGQDSDKPEIAVAPTFQLNSVQYTNLPTAKMDTALTKDAVAGSHHIFGALHSDAHTEDELSSDDVLLSPFGPASVRLTTVETEAAIYNYYMASRVSVLDSANIIKSPSSLDSWGLAITTPSGIDEDATPEKDEEGRPSIRRLSSLLEVMDLKAGANRASVISGLPVGKEKVVGMKKELQQKLDELMKQLEEAT